MNYAKSKIIISFVILVLVILVFLTYLAFEDRNRNGLIGLIPQDNNNSDVLSSGIPVRIIIPSININADIEPIGLDENGAVGAPDSPDGVTWYEGGARPGEMGSAVVTGHYGPWLTGASSVFDDLDKLKIGDRVRIEDDRGNVFTFEVKEKKTYKLNEIVPEIFIRDDRSYLNIITCSGQWLSGQRTFTERLVIFTELISTGSSSCCPESNLRTALGTLEQWLFIEPLVPWNRSAKITTEALNSKTP